MAGSISYTIARRRLAPFMFRRSQWRSRALSSLLSRLRGNRRGEIVGASGGDGTRWMILAGTARWWKVQSDGPVTHSDENLEK